MSSTNDIQYYAEKVIVWIVLVGIMLISIRIIRDILMRYGLRSERDDEDVSENMTMINALFLAIVSGLSITALLFRFRPVLSFEAGESTLSLFTTFLIGGLIIAMVSILKSSDSKNYEGVKNFAIVLVLTASTGFIVYSLITNSSDIQISIIIISIVVLVPLGIANSLTTWREQYFGNSHAHLASKMKLIKNIEDLIELKNAQNDHLAIDEYLDDLKKVLDAKDFGDERFMWIEEKIKKDHSEAFGEKEPQVGDS